MSERKRLLAFALLLLSWLLVATVVAQDEPELLLSNTQVGAQADGFGGETPVVSGDLYNYGSQAYSNVDIAVDAYDADGRTDRRGIWIPGGCLRNSLAGLCAAAETYAGLQRTV